MTKRKRKSLGDASEHVKSVRVEYVPADGSIPPIFANQLVVQNDGQSTYFQFYFSQPPLMLGPPEERKKKIAELESVKAHAVSRVIVPNSRMPAFIKVITDNFNSISAVLQDQTLADAIRLDPDSAPKLGGLQ